MSYRERTPLFSKYSLDSNLRDFSDQISGDIDAIREEQFIISTDDQIVKNITAKKTVDALAIFEDKATMQQSETQINVSGWRDRDWGRDDKDLF